MKKVIEIQNIKRNFQVGDETVHALRGVSFNINEGEFVTIMGTSGSGKSTLLYVLSGMDKATAGEVLYQGSDLTAMKEKQLAALRKQDFGFIFQQMHLVSNLTIFENVAVAGYLEPSKTAAQVKKETEKLLEQMGLSQVKNHLPSQVSGGQQQRCAIARAVIHTPKLLFADEPTGALNRANTTEVLNLLTQYNQAGQSILMVTHDLRAALRADRILYLEDGKITGELKLPPYDAKEEHGREAQVNAWLTSLSW